MKKALVYLNTTGNQVVDKQMEGILMAHCEEHGYEVLAIFGENTDRTGMSEPTCYMGIGLAVMEQLDVIVTLFEEMVGDTEKKILRNLDKLNAVGVQVEAIVGNMNDYYELLYKEAEEEDCLDMADYLANMHNFFVFGD